MAKTSNQGDNHDACPFRTRSANCFRTPLNRLMRFWSTTTGSYRGASFSRSSPWRHRPMRDPEKPSREVPKPVETAARKLFQGGQTAGRCKPRCWTATSETERVMSQISPICPNLPVKVGPGRPPIRKPVSTEEQVCAALFEARSTQPASIGFTKGIGNDRLCAVLSQQIVAPASHSRVSRPSGCLARLQIYKISDFKCQCTTH
jgi:hypothetical protein